MSDASSAGETVLRRVRQAPGDVQRAVRWALSCWIRTSTVLGQAFQAANRASSVLKKALSPRLRRSSRFITPRGCVPGVVLRHGSSDHRRAGSPFGLAITSPAASSQSEERRPGVGQIVLASASTSAAWVTDTDVASTVTVPARDTSPPMLGTTRNRSGPLPRRSSSPGVPAMAPSIGGRHSQVGADAVTRLSPCRRRGSSDRCARPT